MDPNAVETPQLNLKLAKEGAVDVEPSNITIPHNEDNAGKKQRARPQRPKANGRAKNLVLIYNWTCEQHRT